MSDDQSSVTHYKEAIVALPFLASALAITWEVGRFFPMDGFFFFSLTEHLVAAVYALPFAVFFLVIAAIILNSERVKSQRPMLDNWGDFFILGALVICFVVIGAFSGNSVFLYSVAACLAMLIAIKPKIGSFAGNVALCTVGLVLSLSLGIDFTRLELFAAKDLSETVTTKGGAFPARVMMTGERGVLLFRADKQTFKFRRPDEVLSIEWSRNRAVSSK